MLYLLEAKAITPISILIKNQKTSISLGNLHFSD